MRTPVLLLLAASAALSQQQQPSIPYTLRPMYDLVNDYGNTRRYAAENQKLAPPAAGESRVVFMGDSITDAWGRGGFASTAPFFPGKPYVNRGISGQVTAQMLLRFYPDVIALHPKAVLFLAGTNDIGGNIGPVSDESIENNLMAMADMARANGIRVILASILPVCDYHRPQTAQRPPERILAINRWLKDYAAQNRFVYLDYFSATVDDKGFFKAELTNDGLHPNAAGYAVMAPLAEKAIAEALGR
ncbi:MAG TPA: SGNH/GDSL hydrolase family protein [Bryobacteraceae bacterium]|jgi:lysophospholipase L1-like esterase|nr:SGNH/GDSL hydrolase family protein [Bryobacteraceae bacterium]